MSGAPKRPHEEAGHTSSKHSNEDSGAYPKLSSAVSNEYRIPYDVGQDSRVAKAPRNESRDADRRSPLHSMYRMPSSSHDSHIDYPVASENRLELRDSKDSRDIWFENRDMKTEKRELYADTKKDSQNAKSDKDVRFESRGDEIKDLRYDRDSHNDTKVEMKIEKDGYGVSSSHLNWKDSKEYQRGKRYSEAPSGSLDSWNASRGHTQGPIEVGKEGSTTEERDYMETHVVVGENKVDSKVDDNLKEKDRKRKDMKHRDWGEREKERSDSRSSALVANSSGEFKESAKEERDTERWERERERERRDLPKDKEALKEREKEQIKREPWNGIEKDSSQNEKELGDGSVRIPEQENLVPEQKKHRDFDSWKNIDKEDKDRRKEKDPDAEGERSNRRSRSYDKESNDGCADGEGATEKEREVYNYGVQQRKRMQRSRGIPLVANREGHFRSSTQDTEGLQAQSGVSGKAEVPYVVYKVGECMQELIKLWMEYESSQMEKNAESSKSGPTLEIRIPAEHVTATNRQVRGGQLWGRDVYTYDSDLVAVLMHTGYCRPTASPPPAAIEELRATIRVLPPQDCYISTLRNNVRSRAWGAAIGCSYRVERCCIAKKGGGSIDLEPCLTHTSTVEPTLAPVTVERTMTTRAAASNALRQQKFVREVTIQYNLCNEPWIKYSISIVADKGLKKPLYTSARLKKGEVLYLETHSCRYELCFTGEKMVKATTVIQMHEPDTEKSHNHHSHSTNGDRNECDNVMIDLFRWSRCKKPLPQKVMRTVGIPLPLEHVEVLEENLDWEDVQWSQTGVWVAGKEYTLARVHFL
ncbi:zinc finger CCCH domain-containing protein 13-like isoform X2 [Quillaja saponaria]|uniref:Zinc finger CCCH domain-containing protein 13-like isoform X2 n=1 Tax=Quillaja saponaria TaxID=32244 RepID=A0AAD7Q643_QUISA|nr:zinc finger CCCH domain-containing protein 13-like isoform X2 [Quillaja saponaria]